MTSDDNHSTSANGTQAKIINDLMDLFHSNSRGYGLGEFQGAKFNEDKSKWVPGGVRWVWGETTPDQWSDHLTGVRLLGQGVLCDDNRVWYACLDVDIYEIDYADEMAKIKRSGLPLVVFRTKSGGLRVTIFFSEAIDADLVIPRMRKVSSTLGYAGCEIFPKQTKLDVENGDCPSWIYMPYAGTNGVIPEQGCMTEAGNLMQVEECISYAMSMRLTQAQFMDMFAAEDAAKANGKANGKKHPRGFWVEEDTYEKTINAMLWDGPVCLLIIAKNRCRDMQNNYLVDFATFAKKKYPENWEKPLEYANYNILQPVGDREKLNSIIKRFQGHDYNYMCDQEPICSHCHSHACRQQRYGVGPNGGPDDSELGLTRVDRVPSIYFGNAGDKRIQFAYSDFLTQNKYRERHLEYGAPLPPKMKNDDYEIFMRRMFENMTVVQPTSVMRTNAAEIALLTRWFYTRIPMFMRVGEKGNDDPVRVKVRERQIYFKEWALELFLSSLNRPDADAIRTFVENKCEYHGKDDGGHWWRCTYSIPLDTFNEEVVNKWLNVDPDNS